MSRPSFFKEFLQYVNFNKKVNIRLCLVYNPDTTLDGPMQA